MFHWFQEDLAHRVPLSEKKKDRSIQNGDLKQIFQLLQEQSVTTCQCELKVLMLEYLFIFERETKSKLI